MEGKFDVQSLSRIHYLDTLLCAKPDVVTASEYKQTTSLFLDDSDDSELEVRYLTKVELNGSRSSTFDTSASVSTLVESPVSPSGEISSPVLRPVTRVSTSSSFAEWKHQILRSADEVQEFFNANQNDLTLVNIGQENSLLPLDVTKGAFEQLRESASIFPAIQDNILHIGHRSCETEVAPPVLRSRFLRHNPRSVGFHGLELVYGIRYVEPNNRESYKERSLRQTVVYSKTEFAQQKSFWLTLALSDSMRRAIKIYSEERHQDVSLSPIDMHVILISTALASWRPHLAHLSLKLHQHTNHLHVSPHSRGFQALKGLEDELLDARLSIRATQNVVTQLKRLHTRIRGNQFSNSLFGNFDDLDAVTDTLVEKYEMAQLLLEQIDTLHEKTKGLSQTMASFLTLSNGTSLQELGKEAQLENRRLAEMSDKAHQEAKAVTALTVITLIYLPITVVLNFFSASFVDVRDGRMTLVGHWWLFVVVGAPLTVMTLLAWRVWVQLHRSELPLKERFQRQLRQLKLFRYASEPADPEVGRKCG